MIQLELGKPEELMALYQAVMAGKFAEGAEEMLFSEPLANAANKLVDTVLNEVRNSQNQPMVEAMESWRNLQPHYPQFQTLLTWLATDEAAALEQTRVISLLKIAASPLVIEAEVMEQLLAARVEK